MRNFVSLIFLIVTPAMATENPFMPVRDRYRWAIEQVREHKVTDDSLAVAQADGKSPAGKRGKEAKRIPQATAPVFQTQTFNFETETDQAKINIEVTDLGTTFLIDVASDQVIEGWLLKIQSTREVFLKGGAPTANQYKCRIRVDRPYIKDFGFTIYVTDESVPAFVQLF